GHCHGAGAGGRQGDGEVECRVAGVADRRRDKVDGQGGQRVVVGDDPESLAVGQGGIGGRAEVDKEALVGFDNGVAGHADGDGRGGLPGGERQSAADGRVVATGGGGDVGGAVGHCHRARAGGGQDDGEVERGAA